MPEEREQTTRVGPSGRNDPDGSASEGQPAAEVQAPPVVASARPAMWKRSIHIYALYGMSIAQTVLTVLSNNPSFLVVRRSTVVDIVAFLCIVLLAIPAILVAIPYLLGRLNETAGWIAHLVILGSLATLFVTDLYGNIFGLDSPGVRILVMSIASATLLVYGYLRIQLVRDLMLAIVVAPIAITILFILNLPPLGAVDAPAVSVGIDGDNPVVMVVLDEFSLPVLLNSDGSIDASRFPNFASLADTATWYPMTTTVHDGTLFAVPAILTGQIPKSEALPIASNHPVNLFTVLAETHEMNVFEDVTRLCPDRMCASTWHAESLPDRLGSLIQDTSVVYLHSIVPHDFLELLHVPGLGIRWRNFLTAENAVEIEDDTGPTQKRLAELSGGERRTVEAGRFVDSIDASSAALYYLHIDLPHAPYSLLPDGSWYRWPASSAEGNDPMWLGDQWWRQQILAKYSANVGYADLVIGEILRQLDEVGILEEAMVVVLSDHGVSFVDGEPRRLVTDGNFAELASVPLFIKYPHQDAGVVDMRNARTIDVFPTVVDVLGGNVETEGTSLLGEPFDGGKQMQSREGPPVFVDFDTYTDRFEDALGSIESMIATGVGHAGLVAEIGPVPLIHGHFLAEFEIRDVEGDVSVVGADSTNRLDLEVGPPAVVVAEVTLDTAEPPERFALVADGVVVATTTAFETSPHSASVRFFVNPEPVVDAGGVVSVVGVTDSGGGAFSIIRFV